MMNLNKFINNFLLKNSIYNNINIIELSEKNDKNNFKKDLININNLSEYYQLDKLTIIKLLYFNKNYFHNILYFYDNLIELSNEKEENLSFYFYLALLIKENPNFINYSYSIDFIKKIISHKDTNDNLYKNIIKSKIILDIINNYKGFKEYNNNSINEIKIYENDNIKKLEDNLNIFNKLNLNWKKKDIISKNIDEIYIEIIIALIKIKKLCEYDYINNIIKQLDFESIDITHKMYNKIKIILDNNKESYINYYLISNEDDLFNNIKINFYYILLNYILKSSFFIYNIKILLQTRNFILKLINCKYNKFSYINKKEQNIQDRFDFILKKLIDSKYYENKYEKLKDAEDNSNELQISKSNYSINIESLNDKINEDLITKNFEINEVIINNSSSSMNKISSNLYYYKSITKSQNVKGKKDNNSFFLKFEKIIGNHEKNSKNDTANFIVEISDGYISGGMDTLNIYINNGILKKKKNIWIYNVFESENKNTKNLILNSKDKIKLYKLNKEKNSINEEDNYKIDSIFALCGGKDEIYCCGKNKTKLVKNIFIKDREQIEYNVFENVLLKSGIRISNNLIVFKSNKVVSKGIDKLKFFDILTKNEIENNIREEYSFNFSVNGLTVMTIEGNKEKENYNENKILLCACKKYIKKQKNGILLVVIDNKYNNFSHIFYDTHNFEVYCFCPLFKLEEKKIIEQKIEKSISKYFLVGGFEKEKNIGAIKLYKLNYKKPNNKINIEYIQDIKFKDNSFFKFKMPISSIIQSNKDGRILITCWDGKVYLFEYLNINYNLNYDDNFNKNITFNDFFKF